MYNTEEDKTNPGSPQLQFDDDRKSSDEEYLQEDVFEDVNIGRPERTQSDLESSSSSGYIKRLEDSQTDEDDYDQFRGLNRPRN